MWGVVSHLEGLDATLLVHLCCSLLVFFQPWVLGRLNCFFFFFLGFPWANHTTDCAALGPARIAAAGDGGCRSQRNTQKSLPSVGAIGRASSHIANIAVMCHSHLPLSSPLYLTVLQKRPFSAFSNILSQLRTSPTNMAVNQSILTAHGSPITPVVYPPLLTPTRRRKEGSLVLYASQRASATPIGFLCNNVGANFVFSRLRSANFVHAHAHVLSLKTSPCFASIHRTVPRAMVIVVRSMDNQDDW